MCSPSSSADRARSLAAGSILIDEDPLAPLVDLPGAELFILEHGSVLGPCAAWFIRTLWAQAAQRAYQESVELFRYAHRYTPHRLEQACQRALLYHLEGLPALRFILAEQLDQLPPRPNAEAAGQLLLPFADSLWL